VTSITVEVELVHRDRASSPRLVAPNWSRWLSRAGSNLAPGHRGLPTIATIRFSLYDETATKFVGLHNFASVFSTTAILTAFKNNIVWVLVFPFFVTFIASCRGAHRANSLGHGLQGDHRDADRLQHHRSALVWRTIFDLDPTLAS